MHFPTILLLSLIVLSTVPIGVLVARPSVTVTRGGKVMQYFGRPHDPIRLYEPYNNRECLHCHSGARSFEEGAVHSADPDLLPALKANKISCLSSGCHDMVHNVGQLNNVRFWKGAK